MNESEIRRIIFTALVISAGVLIPQLFHLFGLGAVFLPMFLPLMIGAMFLKWNYALLSGIVTPLVSWLITGMPPLVPPILPILMVELSVATLFISLVRTRLISNPWIIVILAIVLNRLILLVIVTVVFPIFGYEHALFRMAFVLSGIPGLIMQIIIIPPATKIIKRTVPFISKMEYGKDGDKQFNDNT